MLRTLPHSEETKRFCALALMTKAPRAGQVKTRLIPPLSPEEAATLNRCFLQDMSVSILSTAAKSNVLGFAVYTPAEAASDYEEIVPESFRLLPQRGEALGERIIFAFEDLFRMGFGSVCLLGSDSPTIPPQHLTEASTILARPEETVVLGPTDDGGYYLVGLNKMQRPLFQDIDWSTEKVLEQTCARAREMGLAVHLLPTWYDVDNAMALRRLCADLFVRNANSAESDPAPATRLFLEGLLKSRPFFTGGA